LTRPLARRRVYVYVYVPLLVVSQILGHSSVKLTADTYSHVFAPALRQAAAAMEAALG